MNEGQIREAQRKLREVDGFLEQILLALKPVEATPVLPVADVGLQDPAGFYDYIRGDEGELFPVMRQSQLDGIQSTLKMAAGRLPLPWCAYVLATEYHETAKTMQGVREGLNASDAWRRKHLRYYPWYGRGKVQLTWEANYRKATERLCELGFQVDLIANPDQALDNEIGAAILVIGMIEGWFTGKKLRDFIPAEPEWKHYVNARRIINGTDKDELIAGYAIEFHKALKEGDWK